MVSAVNQKEKLAECIQAGAIDFIVKPFDKAGLRGFFVKYLTAENEP
jgi:two-component system chemotaxis response regulator CheY